MEKGRLSEKLHKHTWRDANVRLLPSAVLLVTGAILTATHDHVRGGKFGHRIVALIGLIIFVVFATAFLRVLTKTIYRLLAASHLSAGRAGALQFVLRIIGYVTIFLMTLNLLAIPVGKLLLGGAAVGIILGVAAQQSLANLFASIVLIVSHPFSVGDRVVFNSGGLGGRYDGKVKDIGLTHTKLRLEDGTLVLLPNTALLSGAAIISTKHVTPTVQTQPSETSQTRT